MTDLPKFSLSQQVEAVRFAETRQASIQNGGSCRELRPPKVADFDTQRLGSAARTLEWLKIHEDEIKAFLALPAEAREAVLRHGEAMGAMCLQLASAEAVAKAGGPVR
jgi:hypothetical protein